MELYIYLIKVCSRIPSYVCGHISSGERLLSEGEKVMSSKTNNRIFKFKWRYTVASVFFLPELAFAQSMTHAPNMTSAESVAPAQSMTPPPSVSPGAAAVQTLPTNVAGVRIVPPPPAGFNPLTASAHDRQLYAIPPAPNATANPGAFGEWLRAMTGPRNSALVPTVSQTNIKHGPVKLAPGSSSPGTSSSPANQNPGSTKGSANGVSNAGTTTYSYNWSGPSFYDTTIKPFAVSAIIGEFTVPTVRQAFGGCDGGWDYSSEWAGIDGFGSNDVMQAGIEADAYCNGSTRATFYSAWVEWYPYSESRVTVPSINPGDVVFVQIWNVSSTVGYAYFYDFSTLSSAEYQLTAPSGTTLVGNSAEWVVERPSVGANLATLANYIDASWPYNVAWTYAAANPAYYLPGYTSGFGTTQLYSITMLDNNGNPISTGTAQNNDFLYFENYGSSLGSGTSPYALGPAIVATGSH